MTYIPARPTTYRGIQMRSRLEARYAAYLDADPDVQWEYEPRAFGDQNGQYLPDFRVQHKDFPHAYVEVKPTLDKALACLDRVQIIRSSEPDAVLMVVVPDIGGYLVLYVGRSTWIWVN